MMMGKCDVMFPLKHHPSGFPRMLVFNGMVFFMSQNFAALNELPLKFTNSFQAGSELSSTQSWFCRMIFMVKRREVYVMVN